ncbi:MAG: AMP-dependent synthetase and ligase [Rickettsiaceae bacterium]|jgi:long-chain acyl-CoA synthetase|nr:AMP-dependent synthetase and ligase [Rickettsiaceae bacterium]
MKNFSTLIGLVDFVAANYQNKNALNFRYDQKQVTFSTEEFARNVKSLALGLGAIGLKKSDGFGIISKSSPLWVMMDLAVIAGGGISVPIFPDIAPQNLLFEVKDSNIKFAFCDCLENLHILQNNLLKSGISLTKIIIYGFDFEGEGIIKFEDLLKNGQAIYQQNPQLFSNLTSKINDQDLATIIYTSGSTGTPKGVEITHRNLISQIHATEKCFPLDRADVALSCLPLAHIFERMVMYFYISQGVSIYFADDVKNIGPMLQEIRPTLMTVVPRMLEKIVARMHSAVSESNFLKKIIGKMGFCFIERENFGRGKFDNVIYKIFDFLLYKKLCLIFGGRLRMVICGGAALSLPVEKFFHNIGINLYVGYGLTESSPVIAANCEKARKIGTVGKAFPGAEVKVEKDGELLARGENIMRGYHNAPEKTKEAIDENGWLKTGDMAEIDEEGFIKIIGRKKEMFKTVGGKYVSPVPIEQKLMAGWQVLSAACVIAEGRKFVSCLLFADFDILAKYKKKTGFENMSDKEFLASDFVQKRLHKLIADINKTLNHWEQIQKYHLCDEPISIKTGELTPSMKLRRSFVEEKFKDIIDGFYS